MMFLSAESPRVVNFPTQGGKTKNEASGNATGSIRFIDCDSAEVARLEWNKGRVTTSGDQEVQGGCEGDTSSSL